MIIFAMAWGMHHHVLDTATYLPVIARGWHGLVSQIYAIGRLGNIQPISVALGDYPPSSSYVYGIDAFLMAASQVDANANMQHRPHSRHEVE